MTNLEETVKKFAELDSKMANGEEGSPPPS
jgi:hypothetical protein